MCVGVAIEERDIADLKARIAATDRADLKAMYGNLLRASQSHLNAFTRQLDGSAGADSQAPGRGGYGGGQGQGPVRAAAGTDSQGVVRDGGTRQPGGTRSGEAPRLPGPCCE